MKLTATGVLLSPVEDVWKLVGEPYHLPDWWPGYAGVQPDRRGLAEGARWAVVRGSTRAATSNLLRRPGGEGVIVIRRIVERGLLAWHDVQQEIEASISLEPAATRRTTATVAIEGSWTRITFEGLRPVPKEAVRRLVALCQTAAEL